MPKTQTMAQKVENLLNNKRRHLDKMNQQLNNLTIERNILNNQVIELSELFDLDAGPGEETSEDALDTSADRFRA